MNWLSFAKTFDRSKPILSLPTKSFGGESYEKTFQGMLEGFNGDIKIQGNNLMDNYCALYRQVSTTYQYSQQLFQQLILMVESKEKAII